MMLDAERGGEWIDRLASQEVIRVIGPNEWIERNHFDLPFPVTDRETLVHVTLTVDAEAGSAIIRSVPVEDPASPLTKGRVRARNSSIYRMVPIDGGLRTLISMETSTHPGGLIPAFLVRVFQRDFPKKTLAALQRQCAKRDIHAPPRFDALLASLVLPPKANQH
jgi:hypothetical protein